jgi:peptidoglycan hydrolase-like protein with peptidoglycan-binding domain
VGAVLAERGSGRRAPAARARQRPVERPLRIGPASTLSADDVLSLQRTVGNQAVQRVVGGGGGLLRLGSKGPDVKALQEGLIGAGASLTADGSFGPKTRQAVVAVQQSAGLAADGVAGPKTWSALQAGTVQLGPSKGGKAAGVDPQMATLAGLLASIGDLVRKRANATGRGPAAALGVEPSVRQGWFDDAADWVEDKASSAAGAVSTAASSATDWVEDKASAAASWVEDKAGAAASWVEDKAGAAVDAASGAATSAAAAGASAMAASVGNLIGGPVKALADAVGALAEEASPLVKGLVAQLEQVIAAGGATTGLPVEGLIDKAKAAYAELAGGGGDGEELSGGAGGASLDFKKSVGTATEFTFDEETFGALRVNLTARTTEIGRALPSIGAIVLNGKDGTKLPGDEVVTSAKVSVTENITLPVWSKENGPKVQDAQRKEWQRYRGAVAAHEDLHASDDQGIYGKAVGGLVGKTVTDAFAAIDAATEAGNKQGPVRDTANPAPILNPAGVEKV